MNADYRLLVLVLLVGTIMTPPQEKPNQTKPNVFMTLWTVFTGLTTSATTSANETDAYSSTEKRHRQQRFDQFGIREGFDLDGNQIGVVHAEQDLFREVSMPEERFIAQREVWPTEEVIHDENRVLSTNYVDEGFCDANTDDQEPYHVQYGPLPEQLDNQNPEQLLGPNSFGLYLFDTHYDFVDALESFLDDRDFVMCYDAEFIQQFMLTKSRYKQLQRYPYDDSNTILVAINPHDYTDRYTFNCNHGISGSHHKFYVDVLYSTLGIIMDYSSYKDLGYFVWVREETAAAYICFKKRTRTRNDSSALPHFEAQGDSTNTQEQGEQSTLNSSTNVELVENRTESTGQGALAIQPSIQQMAYSIPPDAFNSLTDRWNNLGTQIWEVGDLQFSILETIDLPYDLISILQNNPALLPALQYTYWTPNLTFRAQLTSTKFHSGMLVIGVRYYAKSGAGESSDRAIKHSAQIFQLDYATLNAASSNIAELKIPFASYLDMIPIRENSMGSSSYFATIYIGVASPLRIGEGGSTAVTYTKQIQFQCDGIPTEFFGQNSALPLLEAQGLGNLISTIGNIGGSIVGQIPGMSGVGNLIQGVGNIGGSIVNGITGASSTTSAITRLTTPSDAAPLMQYPSAALSSGFGAQPGRSLRLNPTSRTPHMASTVPTDGGGFSNADLATKWGLVATFQVSTQQDAMTQLFSMPITPMLAFESASGGVLPTPLAGVAGGYAYWSGEMEVKLVVIKADPQSLRLRLSTLPNNLLDAEQLNDQPSTIQDFQEISEITYDLAFLAPTKTLPTVRGNELLSAGFFSVRLETKLVTIESCSTIIDVLVFVRAKPTFNLSIPRQMFWTPDITTTVQPVQEILIDNLSNKPLSIVRFDIRPPSTQAGEVVFTIDANDEIGYTFDTSYCYLMVSQEFTDRFTTYLLNYPTTNFGVIINGDPRFYTFTWNGTPSSATVVLELNDGEGFPTFEAFWPLETLTAIKYSATPNFEAQGDERSEQSAESHGPQIVAAISAPELLFGECFSLKETLQRYQTVLSHHFTAEGEGWHTIDFDLTFGELKRRLAGKAISNLTFYHDGFRFSKGSLAFQLIPRLLGTAKRVLISHTPGGLNSSPILDPEIHFDGQELPVEQSFFSHEIIANESTTIPITPPYYNYTNVLTNGFDPRTEGIGAISAYSFGKCSISTYLKQGETFAFDLQRAIGEDAEMYLFQGWPFCTNVLEYANVNEQVPLTRSKIAKPINNRYRFNNQLLRLDAQMEENISIVEQESPLNDPETCSYCGVEHRRTRWVCDTCHGGEACDYAPTCWSCATKRRSGVNPISALYTETKTRSQRVNLRKYMKHMNKMTKEAQMLLPQIPNSLLPGVENFVQNVIVAYRDASQFPSYIPPNLAHYIKEDHLRSLQEMSLTAGDDDLALYRSIIMDVMVDLNSRFANFPQAFFKECVKAGTKEAGYISNVARLIGNSVPDSIKNLVADTKIFQGLKSGSDLLKTIYGMIMDFLSSPTKGFTIFSQLRILCCASEFWVKAYAFTTLLAQFGFIQSLKQMAAAAGVCELLKLITPKHQHLMVYGLPSFAAQADFGEEDTRSKVASFAALVAGGVAATCGFATAPNWSKGISEFATILGRVTNGWYGLLTKTCTFITDYIVYLLGIESPESLAITELKALGTDVETWAQEVLVLTDPSQIDVVTASPSKRERVSTLYEQGSVFLRTLLENKNYPKQAQTFFALWRKLVDLYSVTGEVPNSIRANTAPYCIYLSGPPGIGKSELAKGLASSLCALNNIAYDGDPFFIRNSRKYWDGCTNQPVIIFDDALQIRSPESTQRFLEDWYGLLTNAPFSPEFANITEKRKFITPHLVIACSNSAFPSVNGVSNLESFYRRRDVLLDVQLSAAIKEKYPGIVNANSLQLTSEDFKDFQHLTFRQYSATHDKNAKLSNETYTFKQLIQALYPNMKKTMERRMASASKQLEAGSELSPERITAARERLLAEIAPVQGADLLMSSVSALADSLDAQAECKLGKQFYGDPDPELCCLYGCNNLPKRCMNSAKIECLDWCESHKCFVNARTSDYFVLSECETCGTTKRTVRDLSVKLMSRMTKVGVPTDDLSLPYINEQEPTRSIPAKVLGKLSEYMDGLKNGPMRIGWYIGIGLALSFALLFLVKFLGLFNKIQEKISGPPAPKNLATQMASSGSVNTNHTTTTRFVSLKSQGATDDLVKRCLRNRLHVTVTTPTGITTSSYALGIVGRTFVIPKHTILNLTGDSIVNLRLNSPHGEAGSVSITGDHMNVEFIGELDLAVVELTCKTIPQFQKIVGSLPTEKELSTLSSDMIILDVLAQSGIPALKSIKTKRCDQKYFCTTTQEARYLKGFCYQMEAKGMCGSILIDPRMNRICGMHIAGRDGQGAANLLAREYFSEYEGFDVEEPSLEKGGMVNPVGDFLPLGKVLDGQAVRQPLKTQIEKSSCVGVLSDPVRFPVKFREEGELKPGLNRLTAAVEKGGSPPKPWSPALIDEAVSDLRNCILTHCKPVTQAVGRRSFEEAIVGRPNVPFQDALKRNTSVGWPLCTLGLGTKKKDFIQYEETSEGLRVSSVHPKVVELYNVNHAKRCQGVIPFSPYMNFLKDERLKPGKMPRLINGCPLDQVIEFRRYVLDFCSATQKNGMEVGIAIGINVHGWDWSNLANSLLSMGDSIACGDYSGFGPGLDPNLVLECANIVNAWYREYQTERCSALDEDDRIRTTLFENLAFSTEVSLDTVLQTLCGSPSGNPFTALINSMVNLLYIRLAWLEFFSGTNLGTMSAFHQYTKVFVYGDDLIISLDDSIKDYFNNETLQAIFAEHAIKYTDADKTGNIRKYIDLSQATFLKCYFVPHPTRGEMAYLAGLEKPMIEDIPNWIRTPYTAKDEVSRDNCIEAARLSYAWGKEYFAEVCGKLEHWWMERGMTFPIETWEYLDDLFFGDHEVVTSFNLDYNWA